MTATIAPVLKWPGAKWNLAEWIVGQLPTHRAYLEPFAGSLAVLFTKDRSPVETVNDLDGEVVNLFTVIRQRPDELAVALALTPYARAEFNSAWADPRTGEPVEDARRFLVRLWQNHGSRAERKGGWAHTTGARIDPLASGGAANRPAQWAKLPDRVLAAAARLQGVHIECRPALDILARHANADCLVYADPPYPRSTRNGAFYGREMTDADHEQMLAALEAHPGPVVLSGYACDLYDSRLAHWRRLERAAVAEGGRARTEVLWLNPVAVRRLERANAQPRLLEVPA